jgi:hypothetical protein
MNSLPLPSRTYHPPMQRPQPEDHLLPGTSLNQNDWECELILAYAQAGKPPAEAVRLAKQIVFNQLNTEGWAPGEFPNTPLTNF